MTQNEELKDDDRPSNILEQFSELEEVLTMIDNLKERHSIGFEKEYETFTEILTRYQEQPHLLDHHIETLIEKLLKYIHDPESSKSLMHCSFKYLYTLAKVRTYKALVKFLPHELTDLEFVLDLLEKQDINDQDTWETRYVLLLWMSILVLNPFHMSRLDAYPTENSDFSNNIHMKTKMERIYDICKLYCANNDTCSNVATFLAAKYFVRVDIKDIYLKKFLDWIMEENTSINTDAKLGLLSSVAAIVKHGKREDILLYADDLLKWILSCDYKNGSDFLAYKFYIKIVQRLGLILLRPRIAAWRYKRGSRSLTANLGQAEINLSPNGNELKEGESEDEITVPDAIEDIIEELLQGLRSASSDIRWSAAKGLGRVTNRLPKSLGDEVIGSVIDMFSPLEQHEAWHGACVAIAELAKRGLLLPYRLEIMVPLLMQAFVYDEMKGYMSVGQHIRDAACYMCWAFARAYDPKDFQPFVQQIATGLLITAVFDREINCRRAASAAFQESVGRLGNFPHGIEISTTTDFYSVGLRINSYLQISNYIAQYEEYTKPLIDHLIEKKVAHWDTAIRELTSKTLHKLTLRAPEYMATVVLLQLIAKTESIDINTRHGSILAIGEIAAALSALEETANSSNKKYLNPQIVVELNGLTIKLQKRELFRGLSGEIMKQCCTELIRNCSKAKIDATPQCIESWQQIIDISIINKNSQIRESATNALSILCESYYNSDNSIEHNNMIVEKYIKGIQNDLEEHIRMGYLSALGCLPKFMLVPRLGEILENLIKRSLLPHGALQALLSGAESEKIAHENPITQSWSEARRDGIKALATVVQTVGLDVNDNTLSEYLPKILECYLKSLDEYTLDNRGDIGAWVREASMNALFQFLTTSPSNLLNPDFVHAVMGGLAQQSVEKIDRTRGLAGKLFCILVHTKPRIPHIRHHDRLCEIFPEDYSSVLWLFADHTFPLFCNLLELTDYSEKIVLGLTASIGQLTESLIKYSSNSLFQFLRSHTTEIPRICNEIINVFQTNLLNERITYPMLNFLDILLSSGTINDVLMDESNNFADEIYRLVCVEIRGHKKLYKLISSINVYCQLLQVPRLFVKVISKMAIFLGLTHVHIRKTTAFKLYEALILHGDTHGITEEILDEVLTLLSVTDWGLPLTEIRPIRNQICEHLGIKAPVSATSISRTNE